MDTIDMLMKRLKTFAYKKKHTVKVFIDHKILKKFRPEIFMVETTLVCDLKCPECAMGADLITREKGFMDFDTFKVIADRIRPYSKYTYLHCWGEPMLNPDIIRMIRYASEFSATNISTNCKCLTPHMAEELITSGVSDLVISIDGTTQEVYEKYRVAGDLDKALEYLRLLQELNIRHGNKVNISPQFVVFAHNQHQTEEFRLLCAELGLEPEFKAPYIRENSIFKNADNQKYIRKTYDSKRSAIKAMRTCQDPVKVMTILLDGSVVACCYDHNGIRKFGNIFYDDVLAIWNSAGYKEFRDRVLSGKGDDFCIESCLEYVWKRVA